ncbi:Protein CELLULOSE SYNTHASE INTERACTIVE 3, partial [Bienertia sinuspersici]
MQLADQITKATDEAVQFKPECLELQARTLQTLFVKQRVVATTSMRGQHAAELTIQSKSSKGTCSRGELVVEDIGGEIRCGGVVGVIARDNKRYGKLIIEEGGVGSLLKLAKEGKPEGQEKAARCIGLLWRDEESVEPVVNARVCSVFGKMLKDGQMKEHSKYAIAKRKKMFIHTVVIDTKDDSGADQPSPRIGGAGAVGLLQGEVSKGENTRIKAEMKAMAARALWHLAKGNVSICRSITESRALLCFAVLLEKGQEEVKYNSAMALMEITSVTEDKNDLRKTTFKPTSPAAKAVVDQLLRVVTKANLDD